MPAHLTTYTQEIKLMRRRRRKRGVKVNPSDAKHEQNGLHRTSFICDKKVWQAIRLVAVRKGVTTSKLLVESALLNPAISAEIKTLRTRKGS